MVTMDVSRAIVFILYLLYRIVDLLFILCFCIGVPFERLIKLQRIKSLNIDAMQLKDAALEHSMKRLKVGHHPPKKKAREFFMHLMTGTHIDRFIYLDFGGWSFYWAY